MGTTETEYQVWASDKQTVLADLSVELDEATESHLQLLVNGGPKLQILIPSTYYRLAQLSNSTESSEVFLVLTIGGVNGKVESSMVALNERLEQISVDANALHKVLDLLLAALQKLQKHRGSKRSRHEFENVKSEVDRPRTGLDSEEEDGEEEDGDGSYVQTDDDEGDVDSSCYDIAEVETRAPCVTEFETRTRGRLHKLAEDARRRCEDYQRGSSRDMKNPLMWVRIASKPMLSKVQLHFEVAGTMDERIAAGLGLTLDEPVLLSLEFSKSVWSVSSGMVASGGLPKHERMSASQSVLASSLVAEKYPDDIDRFLDTFGGDRHRSYGLEVLFPELMTRYFEDPNVETHCEEKNPFIRLSLFVLEKLRELPGWCLVCWKTLPFSLTRMRTCDDDLCLYRFEELGLGVSVLDEVKSNPALVDVDLSLACCAAQASRDVFEPFPAFLLVSQEIRGRSGWFSINQRATTTTTTTTKKTPRKANKDVGRTNKRVETLKHVLSSIPAIDKLKECATERALKRALTRAWYLHKYEGCQEAPHGGPVERVAPSREGFVVAAAGEAALWKSEAVLAYDVTRFILMTNRLSLSLLGSEQELVTVEMVTSREPGDMEDGVATTFTHYQFVVVHDTPEKEAYFTKQRERHGSFFAFHGSPAENWYSILRNGLRSMSNTGYMSSGAAHGEGIYLATDLVTSMAYSRATTASWDNGKLSMGFQCIAICEVINGSPRANSRPAHILVVPREHERDVAIRYFLVFKPKLATSFRDIRIEGRVLTSPNRTINLLDHYQNVQRLQEESQESQRLKRMATRSAIFLRALAADHHDAHLSSSATQPVPASVTDVAGAPPPSRPASGNLSKASGGANSSSRAVMQEFRNLVKAINKAPPIASSIERNEPAALLSGTSVTIPDEDNDFSLWRIALHPYLLKESANLYHDFQELKRLRISPDDIPVKLEVKFSPAYPFEPPFVRVLSPRFKMHSGHVTVGGSICMELLTASGWSPACNFESLLVQVVMAFVEGDGRLDLKVSAQGKHEYQEREARDAFQRAARAHGWKTTTS